MWYVECICKRAEPAENPVPLYCISQEVMYGTGGVSYLHVRCEICDTCSTAKNEQFKHFKNHLIIQESRQIPMNLIFAQGVRKTCIRQV